MKRIGLLVALMATSGTQVLAADLLQGRIEQRNAVTRLARPAMPSKPLGDAMEHASSPTRNKPSFSLNASSVSGTLDKAAFDFNSKLTGSAADNNDKVDTTDKELVIEWERWHHNLSEAIYHYWLTYSNIPGEGMVTLTVSREGDIDYGLQTFHVEPSERISADQRDRFERCLERTLSMMSHSDDLVFPQGSHRKSVTLNCNFKHSAADDTVSGYDWKKGDYERVSPR